MHCTDEELLAHLDGELPWHRRFRVAAHLRHCWRCRAIRADIEEQIRLIALATEEDEFPYSDWSGKAKRCMHRRICEWEGQLHVRMPDRSVSPRMIAGAAAVALMIVIVGWQVQRSPGPKVQARLAAENTVREILRREAVLYKNAVHQSFTVQLAQIRPKQDATTAQLETWSDLPARRFASKLSLSDANQQHAMWRSGNRINLRTPEGSAVLTAADAQAASLYAAVRTVTSRRSLERSFAKWLDGRADRPVSLATEILEWSQSGQATVRTEAVADYTGESFVRVVAQRSENRLSARLSIEFTAGTYWPRLQVLRMETPEAAFELRMVGRTVQSVPSGTLDRGVFTGNELRDSSAPAHQFRSKVPVPELRPSVNDGSDAALLRRIEARYVLHQAGACLGEPVKIIEELGGVRVSHHGSGSGAWSDSYSSAVKLHDVLQAFADLRRPTPVTGEVGEGGRVQRLANALLRHTVALQRLAADLPLHADSRLSDGAWRMMETMIREHTSAIRAELGTVGVQPAATVTFRGSWMDNASSLHDRALHLLSLLQDEPLARTLPVLQEMESLVRTLQDGFASSFKAARGQHTPHAASNAHSDR